MEVAAKRIAEVLHTQRLLAWHLPTTVPRVLAVAAIGAVLARVAVLVGAVDANVALGVCARAQKER